MTTDQLFEMGDPLQKSFTDRLKVVMQMVDKLFVLEEKPGKYHLKVEADAIPMSYILANNQLHQWSKSL